MRKLNLFLFLLLINTCLFAQDVIQADRDALMALYNATGGDNWSQNTNWGTTELVSTWHGVTVRGERVAGLSLSNNNLQGDMPVEIGNLTALEDFIMNNNNITDIPDEICNLTNLYTLEVGNNQIGRLPDNIGNLSKLETLNLAWNKLSSLPASLSNLSNLFELNISGNNFNGLPDILYTFTRLNTLGAKDLNLTSISSDIGDLTNLQNLYLANNKIETLPGEINNLVKLREFYIQNNKLRGSLPNLSNLTSLAYLPIYDNYYTFDAIEEGFNYSLTGFYYKPQNDFLLTTNEVLAQSGTDVNIDISVLSAYNLGGANNRYEWFRNQVSLGSPSSNPMLTLSNIDSDDFGVYTCHVTNTVVTDLTLTSPEIFLRNGDLIQGVVQSDYDALMALYNATGGDNWKNKTNWGSNEPVSNWHGVTIANERVTSINLDYNGLIGFIPAEIGSLSKLEYLYLYSNSIKSIPVEIGNLTNLKELILYGNEINTIPKEIGKLAALNKLSLFSNQINSIPQAIGDLSNLEILNLGNNQITVIPVEIGKLSNLTNLELNGNQISTIPWEIGNLLKLERLVLSSNKISTLPSDIGRLINLNHLALDANEIVSIPHEIGKLKALVYLYLQINQLNSIPDEIGELTNLNQLYLQYNQIPSIPSEIGNLTNLNHLHIFNNKITAIPIQIGQLQNLVSLILNDNEITEIPSEIGNLTNLTDLYLFNNNIVSVPTETGNLSALMNLSLQNNKITALPSEISNLVNLKNGYFNNNEISGNLPNINGMLNLNRFFVYDNYYTFYNIEPYYQNSAVNYSPQKDFSVNPSIYMKALGDNLSLDITEMHPNLGGDSFEWFLDGVSLGEASADPVYNKANIGIDDFGIYTCKVYSNKMTDLVLMSEQIEVNRVNSAPKIVNPISDIVESKGFESRMIDLINVFSDLDGDDLTYSVISSSIETATTEIDESTLIIKEVLTGTTTITVTAEDGKGGSVSDDFTFTIEEPNNPPTIANAIADYMEPEGFVSISIDLTNVFTDADEDPLSYSAVSSDTDIATVSIDGDNLVINEVSAGITSITVTADDGRDGTVSDEFVFTIDNTNSFEDITDSGINVYPVPTNGQLIVELKKTTQNAIIQLIDLNGKQIINKSFNATKNKLDISNSPNGVYMMKIISGNRYYSLKIIKK